MDGRFSYFESRIGAQKVKPAISNFATSWSNKARTGLRKSLSCGFKPKSEALYRVWNLVLATLVGLLAAPVIAAIALVLLITSGRPIFYTGLRYGRDRRTFNIVKFRTLQVGAEQMIGSTTVEDSSSLVTPVGRFLRQTRLDELPQVWNVIRGDMNFLGPRPVRPVIADECDATIPNYNRRFDVKPGIIGHVQIFMPHGTPKRIRARYNNILVRRDVNLLGEVALMAFTAYRMLYLAMRPVIRRIRHRVPALPTTEIEFSNARTARKDKRLVVQITPGGQLVAEWSGNKPFEARGTRIVFAKCNHLNSKVHVPVRLNRSYQRDARGNQLFEVCPETPTGRFLIERHILSKSFGS